jgi:4-amino-4-deoxy-L-arabinose transferase-like glycosyltransferase
MAQLASAQEMVHSLEQGKLAPYVRGTALTLMIIALSAVYIFIQFRGLADPDAMDQAQIARSIAAGEGFSTKYVRPLALWQLEAAGKSMPEGNFPDFTQQPLAPILNALPLWLVRGSWEMNPLDIIYTGDRIIVIFGTLFFLLAALVWFFVARELFDDKLAALALAIILLTDLFWQFSISGLPQTLLLLLFGCATWLTLKAMHGGHGDRRNGRWALPLAGLLFGLMILTHGLAVWIFFGWLIFVGILFRRKLIPVLIAVAVCAAVVAPWLARNYAVCGNPFGLSVFTALYSTSQPAESLYRQVTPDLMGAARGIRGKLKDGVINQAGDLFKYLGMNIVAAAFFFSLLHKFKDPKAAVFRWGVLGMWLAAFVGMAFYGLRGEVLGSNQLHVLFLPLFIFFGLAFLLVLWNRIGIGNYLLDKVFAGFLLLLVAIPMLSTIFLSANQRIQWPPYIPPFIAVLGNWFEEHEVLCSDMPWAVAWYANRKTLLIPDTPRTLTRISDYRVLGSPIVALYLTPLTGNQPLVSQIYKGAYREWAGLMVRPPQTQGFFLKSFTPLPIDGECIIFADRERWMNK